MSGVGLTPGGATCPQCGLKSRVRLKTGQVCATCLSSHAWESLARPGEGLVIDRAAIDESVARRTIVVSPLWHRCLPFLPSAGAAALGLASVAALVPLVGARPIGPLASLVAGVVSDARLACSVGGAAIGLGVLALILVRLGRLHRAIVPISSAALGVLAGATTLVTGGFQWVIASQGFGWEHLSMPPLLAASTDPVQDKIMRATVVIVAPSADGDARGASIGAGSVIRSAPARAWIATCSHVAMPYASAAADRDAAKAQTVWVYFSDGHNAPGRVRWVGEPPLDVAVVSVDGTGAPEPVAVAPSAAEIGADQAVSFVPNPFRSGWAVHSGTVLRREAHLTPAGRVSLLYTTLPVQPGDSGTGLFDPAGRLIGINTWATADRSGPVGISLPSDVMERLAGFAAEDDPGTPR